VGKILGLAIDRLHKEVRRQKFGLCSRPRVKSREKEEVGSPLPAVSPEKKENGSPPRVKSREKKAAGSRQIPAAIRRAVAVRNEGRCAYVSPGGRRCTSREFLEFHHLVPWARRRVHDVDGIALRCRGHNQYEAELDFGVGHMRRFRKEAGAEGTRPGASCA
jgi:5-methylcytosine-specific restriction endonuclease McrA